MKKNLWQIVQAKYDVGNIITGKVVVKRANFGVFIDLDEIDNNIIGLIHLPQIITKAYQIEDSVFDIGNSIRCKIIGHRDREYLEVFLDLQLL